MKNIQYIFNLQKKFYNTNETKSYAFRMVMLQKLKDAIIDNEQLIAEALHKDLRKPLNETYASEIGFTIREINSTMKRLKKWMKPHKAKSDIFTFGGKGKVYSEPYGTSLIIGTWNYPINLTLAPLVGAIAGGNTAIVKPSEISPAASTAINKLLSDTFPEEYICCIEGGVEEVTALLDQPFDKIFFTGSPHIGKIVMEKASKHLSNVTLELGGKSPCIIDKGINMKVAVERILLGKLLNNGQTCVAPDYILIREEGVEEFVACMKDKIHEVFGEDIGANSNLTRIINERHFDRLEGYLKDGEILYGGEADKKDLYIGPSVVKVEDLNTPIMTEEIFGPIFPLVTFESYEDIKKITDLNPNPLALYLFTNDRDLTDKILKNIHFGGGSVNDTLSHMINEHLPFGGRGTSGLGSYHGKHTFDAFSHKKSVFKKKLLFDGRLKHIFNHKNSGFIKKFLLK